MADSKMFTIAGTSILAGVLTYRFANKSAAVRTAKLLNAGHVEVNLIDLPEPMTKADAMTYLLGKGIAAVLPTTRKDAAAAPTEEQVAAAAQATETAAAAAQATADDDAAFLAAMSGGADVLLAAAEQNDSAEVEPEVTGDIEG